MEFIFGKNTKQYLIGGGLIIAAIVFLLLVIKYVPLDPTKVEVEPFEEKIHFEVEPDLNSETTKSIETIKPETKSAPILEPSFDVVNVDDEGQLIIAGRAGKNQLVKIYNGNQLLGEVTTNQFGEFVFMPDDKLVPGTYDLSLVSNGLKSQDLVSIIVPGNPNIVVNNTANDVIINTANDVINNTANDVIITVNKPDGTIKKVLQGASNSNEANNLSFDSLSYSDKGTLNLSGKALPGARIDVYIGQKLVGTAYADSEGFWSVILDKPVQPGDYILRFNEIQNDQVIASLETPIRQSDLSEFSVSDNAIVVQPGNSLWRISRRFYGEGVLYTLIFKANQNQINNPDLIYPGQIFEVPSNSSN
jgi:LysM repeat protein